MKIVNLNLEYHNKIYNDLRPYWLTASDFMKPYHHLIFPLYYSDNSFVLLGQPSKVEMQPPAPAPILAYLYGKVQGQVGFIHLISARVDCHRRGYASMLLKKFEESIKTEATSIELLRLEENKLSDVFFTNHGYQIKDHLNLNENESRILMAKKL